LGRHMNNGNTGLFPEGRHMLLQSSHRPHQSCGRPFRLLTPR
jgi:hypothetical protein